MENTDVVGYLQKHLIKLLESNSGSEVWLCKHADGTVHLAFHKALDAIGHAKVPDPIAVKRGKIHDAKGDVVTAFLQDLGLNRFEAQEVIRGAVPPPVIHSDPDILGGTPVFGGTRVPVQTLLDYLESGESLDVFLDHFPTVSREKAVAALEVAKGLLTAHAHPV
jgi:uncharacterized protein (DUF433 family)